MRDLVVGSGTGFDDRGRLVRFGHGFHPLGEPSRADMASLARGLAAAGRDIADLELVGGTRAVFPDDCSRADPGAAMQSIGPQLEKGFTTFCIKPSQFVDEGDQIGRFCREVMRRAEAIAS